MMYILLGFVYSFSSYLYHITLHDHDFCKKERHINALLFIIIIIIIKSDFVRNLAKGSGGH